MTRLTEFASVLTHAARVGIGAGRLAAYLGEQPGGIKALVAAERALRNPATDQPSPSVGDREVLATVSLAAGVETGALVVLIGRAGANGTVDIVGSVADARVVAAASRALG